MAITETIKNLFGKVLHIGTPPEKEVLYKEVIKRKVPKQSAEKLMLDDMKNSVKKVFSTPEDVEFARGTPNPPVKKIAKKKTTAKKTTPKKKATKTTSTATTPKKKTTSTKKPTATSKTAEAKTTTTKKSVDKKTPAKKSVTQKSVSKTTVKKKITEKKDSTKKTTAKKTTPTDKKPTTKKTVSKKSTTTATTVKKKPSPSIKASEKKTSAKTTTRKKVATSKKETNSTAKKSTAEPRGAKKAAKIALYIKDIKKHYGEVDEDFVAIIVKNLGPSIYKRDAELVSCSDSKELDTVRRNFLIKKLGIEASQGVLDAAIQDVCEELKGVRTKYRATFYYSLAKKFKKESVLN